MPTLERFRLNHDSRMRGLGVFLFAATGLILGALLAILSG